MADENILVSVFEAAGIRVKQGKFVLPGWCKRVKIDVGLSHDAPQSRRWIESDPNLLVFGFEPIKKNLEKLNQNFFANSTYLFQKQLRKQLMVFPVALGNVSETFESQMFVTANDSGCSSLLEPVDFEISGLQSVTLTSLELVLEYFPFNELPFIDYLKTDAQGSDFDIVKGLGKFINRVVFVTSESENSQYSLSNNSNDALRRFLQDSGFKKFSHKKRRCKDLPVRVLVDDPTYINFDNFFSLDRTDVFIYQQG